MNSQANTTTITPVKTVWAGYIASNGRVATYVQASWVIPNVDCGPKGSGTSGVVFWVGLGGLFDPSVHRAGTLIVCSGGQSRYSLWYDSHPNDVGLIILLNRTATPGESVSASVSYSNATGEFTYSVQAGNQPTYNASETFPGQPPPVSAEWVVQSAPTFVGPMKMTDFGIVNFLQGSADIGDRMGNISSFEQGSDSHLFLSTFACTDSTIKASARPLNDTSAFAVVWESGGDC